MKHYSSLAKFTSLFLILILISCSGDTVQPVVVLDDDFPAVFDWRDQGVLTPAKQQGNLGSCGVFAGVALVEALIKMETDQTVDLSEQHVINVSPYWNVNGMNSINVLDFIRDTGIVKEEVLPYVASETDARPSVPSQYFLSEVYEEQIEGKPLSERRKIIKNAIYNYGPVATAMDFYNDLPRYTGGIYEVGQNAQLTSGHWIVIFGWSDDPEVKNGGYWICKNSNGTSWGENGFFKLPYGESNVDAYVITYGKYIPNSKSN